MSIISCPAGKYKTMAEPEVVDESPTDQAPVPADEAAPAGEGDAAPPADMAEAMAEVGIPADEPA